MTPEEFADRFAQFIRQAQARITGPGRAYFDGAQCQFENMSPLEIVQEARAEAQDLACYAGMLDIRLQQIEERLHKVM